MSTSYSIQEIHARIGGIIEGEARTRVSGVKQALAAWTFLPSLLKQHRHPSSHHAAPARGRVADDAMPAQTLKRSGAH